MLQVPWPGSPAPGRSVTQVGIAAHIARLRAVAGHELLLVPSVSVLPVDQAGRLLLVRHAGHDDGWGVLGGPDYEVSYPNGDRTAYITAVYEARITHGSPAPGNGELSELAWFTPAEPPSLQLSRFARALLHPTGRL
jgi:hypothetical protein